LLGAVLWDPGRIGQWLFHGDRRSLLAIIGSR
jgi:hypothetical protein